MNSAPSALPLDAESMDPTELSMPTLLREIELQQKPLWLLCRLMNALESKRQEKGLGWSRPWNKVGLNVFRTHIQNPGEDADYLTPALHQLARLVQGAPRDYVAFLHDLISDPALMSFTFYHNRTEGTRQYEGLTLSLGRRVATDRSKRDRIDLILEDERIDGHVDGRLDLVRLYVCPWSQFQDQRHHLQLSWQPLPADLEPGLADLYRHSIEYYHRWKGEPSRQWSHWSANYIDYFGPRSFIPLGTSFF